MSLFQTCPICPFLSTMQCATLPSCDKPAAHSAIPLRSLRRRLGCHRTLGKSFLPPHGTTANLATVGELNVGSPGFGARKVEGPIFRVIFTYPTHFCGSHQMTPEKPERAQFGWSLTETRGYNSSISPPLRETKKEGQEKEKKSDMRHSGRWRGPGERGPGDGGRER